MRKATSLTGVGVVLCLVGLYLLLPNFAVHEVVTTRHAEISLLIVVGIGVLLIDTFYYRRR